MAHGALRSTPFQTGFCLDYKKRPPDAVAMERKNRRERLGPRLPDPLLLPEENPAEYEDLLEALDSALGPRDFLEAIHCRNIANVIWEERRLQRLRRLLVTDERRRALRDYLEEVRVSPPHLLTSNDPGVISRGWVRQDRDALQRLETVFRSVRPVAFMPLPLDSCEGGAAA